MVLQCCFFSFFPFLYSPTLPAIFYLPERVKRGVLIVKRKSDNEFWRVKICMLMDRDSRVILTYA